MSLLRMGNDPRIMEPPAYVSWPSDGNHSSWETKLHRAVLGGKLQKIKDLASRGNNVDALNDSGQTALFCAAFRGSAEVVNLLLSLGSKPNARCQPQGYTAVHGACYNGDPYVLKMLLQAGGDLRLCDNQRRTPLDWAKLQADPTRLSAVRNVVESARLCTTETSGMEMMREIQNNLSPKSSTVLSDVMRNIFRKSVIMRDSKSRFGVHVNMDELHNSIHHTGFGKVYYGTGERCAAVIGLPYVSEVSDLKDEHNEEVPSWMCGKFTSFNPKYWISRKTRVSTREIYHDAGVNAVPDILIQDLEARNKLHHPNLLMLLGVCQTNSGESVSLVYERVSLGSLFSVLHVEQKKLSHRFATDIIIQICDALEYVHAMKMIHCGISSHSVVLVSHGMAKLSCFEYALPENIHGEAAMSSRHPVLTSDAHVNVLKHWMAPEVILKNQYSIRSDVYSLVCVMWELCQGDIPWRSFSLQNLRQVFMNESKQPLPLDKSSTPKHWYNVMDVGLRPNRETRDLDLEEIKNMMDLSRKPANPYVYSKGSSGNAYGRISPDYGTVLPDHEALQIDEVDGQDFHKVIEYNRDDLEEPTQRDTGSRNSPLEPQGILKKFGRSKPSTTILADVPEARKTEGLEKESSGTQTLAVQSIETQTEDTVGAFKEPPAAKPIDAAPSAEAKRPGAIFSLGAGWMKPHPVASNKAIATQTEVRTIRMRNCTSSSDTTISPVTSPTSTSTPLWDSFNGSKASNDVQTNVIAKKSRDSFKEKLAKLLETRQSGDHSANSIGSFRSIRKMSSIKPASHCSTGMFSAEDVPAPDLRNYMGALHLCPSEPYGDKAIKPAGHSIGLELHGKVVPRKSRSLLDLPEIEQEETIHPGFVIETVEKFNAQSEMLGKMRRCISYSRMPIDMRRAVFQPQRYFSQPTEFQRQRVPWEHAAGVARSMFESHHPMPQDRGKNQTEMPCSNSGTDIAIQCMLYENIPVVDEGQFWKSKGDITEKQDIWSQSKPSDMLLTIPERFSFPNPNFRKSASVTEIFGRAGLPVENPNLMLAEGPKRKSQICDIEDNTASDEERKSDGAATRSSMVHDANGDTIMDDVLYLTAQMSPNNSPSIDKESDDYGRDGGDEWINESGNNPSGVSEGLEQIDEGITGVHCRHSHYVYGQSSSFTYGSDFVESKKQRPNRSY